MLLNILLIILLLVTSGIAGYLTWLIVYKWKLGKEANPFIRAVGLWIKIPIVLAVIGITIWQVDWRILVIPNLVSLVDAVNNVLCYFKVRKKR